MISFQAINRPTKLNVALWGPSGAGKTYTGLAIAHQLGSRVAVLDTEHRSASLYTSRFPADVAELLPPYHPEVYIEAIDAAERAGYDVLMMDSLSPEWEGMGGCLSLVEDTKRQGKLRGVRAWGPITPRHEALLSRINRSPLSVVVTFREKAAVVLSDGDDTKTKVSVARPHAVTRERYEYEYDLVLHLALNHHATVTNSRLTVLPEGHTVKADKALLGYVRQALWPEATAVV